MQAQILQRKTGENDIRNTHGVLYTIGGNAKGSVISCPSGCIHLSLIKQSPSLLQPWLERLHSHRGLSLAAAARTAGGECLALPPGSQNHFYPRPPLQPPPITASLNLYLSLPPVKGPKQERGNRAPARSSLPCP